MKFAIKAIDGTYYAEPYVGHCKSYAQDEADYEVHSLADALLFERPSDALFEMQGNLRKFTQEGGAKLVGAWFIEEEVAADPCWQCGQPRVKGCNARRCEHCCDQRCDTHCDRSMGLTEFADED